MINEHLIQRFVELSIQEFKHKTFGSTEQYLEVLEIAFEDGKPLIKRIDRKGEQYIVNYVIKGEKFFYTHYFDVHDDVILISDGITPASAVYLRVYSDKFSLNEILQLTTLKPTRMWQQGKPKNQNETFPFSYGRESVKTIFKDSGIYFEPDKNEAGCVEDKLLNLLIELEEHKPELLALQTNCQMYITLYWEAYYGNTMLGEIYLNQVIIKKLADMNLEVNFDIYTSGKPFK